MACPFPFLLQASAISRHCLMQSSSLNANQALNRMYRAERIRIDTCADDEMPTGQPARDTVGMHVSGLRGSLEHTMDRKFADYYSRSFGFDRISNVYIRILAKYNLSAMNS